MLSAILAYSRGLVREVMAIAGWIGAAIAGLHLRPAGRSRWSRNCPWSASSWPTAASFGIVAAFAAVFALGLDRGVALHAALLVGGAAVRRSAGSTRRWGSCSASCAACCWSRSPSSSMTAPSPPTADPDGRQLALGQGLRHLPGQHRRERSPKMRRAGSWSATTLWQAAAPPQPRSIPPPPRQIPPPRRPPRLNLRPKTDRSAHMTTV